MDRRPETFEHLKLAVAFLHGCELGREILAIPISRCARGVCTGDSFDVLEGSPVDLRIKPKLDRYERLRQELLASGDLVRDGNEGRLAKTVSFSTPSGAADFVLGGSNNGWIEWKDGAGQTLDALYRK